MVSRKQGDYERGRKLMAADTNVAIEAILEVDPDAEITVCDAHGGMNNIDPNDLHKRAVLIRGSPKPQSQLAGINDTYDACLFVGYHSKKGTLEGIMSHTYSGGNIERLFVNGREVGETELNAGIAGHHGVPLIFVAGDQATTQEAKEIHPSIVTTTVKEAIGRTAAACLHPEEARELIRVGVKKALKDLKKIPPHKVSVPVTFTITFTDAKRADAAALIPTAKRISGKTIQITTDDYITGYHAFIAAVLCGTAVST
jgi:D-amino peptidase